jgi:hypothetical protein
MHVTQESPRSIVQRWFVLTTKFYAGTSVCQPNATLLQDVYCSLRHALTPVAVWSSKRAL